jgi:voltage-gated potassium channel
VDRSILVLFRQTGIILVLLTIGYFSVPVGGGLQDSTTWGRAAASVVVLVAVSLLVRQYLRRSRRMLAPLLARVELLLAVLYVLVLGFALLYLVVERLAPGQFDGVEGKVSALYLSATIVSTVGMGDVHPSGAFGQLLTTVQMIFDLLFLGGALRVLTAVRGAKPTEG